MIQIKEGDFNALSTVEGKYDVIASMFPFMVEGIEGVVVERRVTQ